MFSIEYRRPARKALTRMPKPLAGRFLSAFEQLAQDPSRSDLDISDQSAETVIGSESANGGRSTASSLIDWSSWCSTSAPEETFTNDRNVQIIKRDDVPEYAVVPYEEYEALVRLSEQMGDIRAYDAAMADAGETVPHEVVRRLVNGDSPLRVWREYRKLTQAALARKAGIDKTYLSQIETGRKQGSVAALAQLASALSVEVDDLIDFGALDGLGNVDI